MYQFNLDLGKAMFTSEQETKNITWTTEYLTRIQEVNVVFFISKNDEEQDDIKLTLEKECLFFKSI